MTARPDITPDLKVGQLLEAWPELEDELIAQAPPFAKLRNPLLRRTIARVTTLRQAARVGQVPLAELVARLRQAAGLPAVKIAGEAVGRDAGRPDWLDQVMVTERYDARADIEAGQHPVGRVLATVSGLGPDQALELITGFEPSPLIDKARGQGHPVYTEVAEVDGDQVHLTTFRGRD
jgi:hypothetical protein